MTSKEYSLSLWERNYAEIPAVQGEAQARTVNIHLMEEVSVQDALGNLEIRQKPVDITNSSGTFRVNGHAFQVTRMTTGDGKIYNALLESAT